MCEKYKYAKIKSTFSEVSFKNKKKTKSSLSQILSSYGLVGTSFARYYLISQSLLWLEPCHNLEKVNPPKHKNYMIAHCFILKN